MPGDRLQVLLSSRRGFLGAAAAALVAAGLGAQTALGGQASARGLQIWLVRHAESDREVPSSPRPVRDEGLRRPLSPEGVEQAEGLAESLIDAPIVAIYTSTHRRAVETAEAIASRHELPLSLAPQAVEIDLGIGEQDDGRAVIMDLARKWLAERDIDARHGSGESLADVKQRFLPFMHELMNRHARDAGIIVIVTHRALLSFMMPLLSDNVPADLPIRHPLPYASLIKTELHGEELHCTDWAGIPSSAFGS